MPFPFFKQPDSMDCGPACLRMVAKHYGRNIKIQLLRKLCEVDREGVSLLGISDASEKIGFRSLGAKLNLSDLREAELPCILHWRQNHFIVLYRIKRNKYYIADPAKGLIALNEKDITSAWVSDKDENEGVALLLSPTPHFYEDDSGSQKTVSWSFLLRYLVTYRKLVLQLIFGLAIGTLLQLVTPLLTQSIVDIGINNRNLNFIYLVIIAQAMLIIGRVSVDFIRSWILLHISSRVNISILTDFLIKLMKLPISFFDSKMTGDIMQRMSDQQRIENFLTGSTLNTIFSMLSLVVFSVVLAYYNVTIFLVFLTSSILYLGWILVFLKRRREINYKSFEISSKNQSNIVQLITGMQEIKLNNCEQQKRWEWEHLQARLFKFNVKNLALSQYQQGGSTFINESTNLLITLLSAKAVIDGNLTLGSMVAVQYMVGQLNSPIQLFLSFIQGFQDAKISLERLSEIHELDDEEPIDKEFNHELPNNLSVSINNLTFKYPGAGSEPVLQNINIQIPQGKTTAIVGMSGSGKTTILKLLLRFYEPQKGEIKIGDQALGNISFKTWRSSCGTVMQDGFIFSDTIERNIAVGDETADKQKLRNAIKIANIQDLIDGLPLGLNTKIGAEGNGISQGQRQRLLIARAVYKNPQYIFFDEATNALDANNERVIMHNLKEFFDGRTVVIVAHRLSTVSNADNIILLRNGQIAEQGNHRELTKLKGEYYHLVKNQLELGT
ncbi:peptidase domain-containing ABC transporter [Mucilaginibacter rubeus]|uniref:Peptidase domain-containing ABC transporter n=1 Tax=Mucilaginibacter rubeus TaxID=2027860 RepID=A0AAE6JJ10_9SPHI|nr:peptidase domain-containing ABC transporter [Mucilaginibacter rubeus]QEM19094.1 peptidase domain-containing ABC transporter [Mucilaginibacter gossypii]QEM06505.1 peptidase domain-containing ABC transporter [Mucilaginibacter rubeus]QTE44364.1 peptidase domain-containing ABC transporter [Mucilaginibacter rubeus]QTE50964.1 peptidase domain-containing ABC transporter [Mucilaginibacter rubeus]QTE56047.1 peptidase domain-containing ABC transporter [Mucilaginibacter rubeus]